MKSERIDVLRRHLESSKRNIISNPTNAVASPTSLVFQYTLDNPKLTWEQRQFYEDNGFLLIRNLIEPKLLDEFKQHFIDLVEGRANRGQITMVKDVTLMKTNVKGEYLYNKVQDILFDDVFSKYFYHKELLDYVECFTGPNLKGVHSMLINKPPDSGKNSSFHPPHQDLHYFPFRPANRVVAAWTAMEHVHKDNGCLFVLPGSHKGSLLPHGYTREDLNKAYHGIAGYDNYPFDYLEMNKGDTVFFHPLLIHGSGVNITKGFRKAISCHFAACEMRYVDVTGTTQETIAKEVEEMARKKGLILTFEDVWRYRSRLLRGEEKNI